MRVNSTENKHTQRGALFINLGSYLQKLKAIENTRPEDQRRPVPSLSELARDVGSNSGSMSRLARGQVTLLNIPLAGAIIREMRSRGFQMEIWHLIDYIGPDARPRKLYQNDENESREIEQVGQAKARRYPHSPSAAGTGRPPLI